MNLFEKVKDYLNIAEVVESFGVKLNSKGVGLCPFHQEKTGSFSIKKDSNTWKCFGCGEGGDAIDFVSKLKGLDGVESAKLLAEMYHIDIDEDKQKPKKFDVKEYLTKCIEEVSQTDYFIKRGLSLSTIKKYCLGYDSYRKSVVIPYSSKLTYYQTRSIENKKFFKPKTEDCGAEPLFNGEAMYKSKEPVFVVESPICALSIMQCGANAIALCGVGNVNKLIKEVKCKKPNSALILSLDNDEAGKLATQDLSNQLFELGVKFCSVNVAGDYKDPNELLQQSPKQLADNLANAKAELRKKYATDKDSFDAYDLMNEKLAPITWIVENLLPTGLSILCAPSKYGKSWMVLQLCLAVSEGKSFLNFQTKQCECLYYALEDGKSRLQDRMKKVVKGPISKGIHFVLKADTLETGLLNKITEEITSFPNIKLVIIDTLQKVRGKMSKDDTLYGNEYREMAAVKDFADKHKICVLFVHHTRKMKDEDDVFNMISGSTAIMGAADTILIISKKKRNDDSSIFSVTGRDIQQNDLVIGFDKTQFKWQVEGTAEEVNARREREEYETNVYVQTIKELVHRNPVGGWSGSAQDLMKAVFDITKQQVADSPSSVGKQISKYEYRLHCDDIDHKTSKSNGRAHTFIRIDRNFPNFRQRTLYDNNED